MPGEIVLSHKDGFYSYDAKYVDPNGAFFRVPAQIPAALAERVRALSVATFRVLELAGLARVDFFVDRRDGALYVNEVNTMPGFTEHSGYPKMWESSGLDVKQLVSRLIDLGLERRRATQSLKLSPAPAR
jgi:D-alanine-D-alanine ligase